MRKTLITLYVSALSCLFLLSACSESKLVDIHVDKSFKGKHVSNILVIGVTYKEREDVRRHFEDSFAKQLKAVGIEAVSGGDAISIPSDLMLKKEHVVDAIHKYHNDAVLISQISQFSDKESRSRDHLGTTDYYGFYSLSFNLVRSPHYSSSKTTYGIKTRLYDVKTEKLIWSGITRTVDPTSGNQVMNDVINSVIKDLQRNDIIPKI